MTCWSIRRAQHAETNSPRVSLDKGKVKTLSHSQNCACPQIWSLEKALKENDPADLEEDTNGTTCDKKNPMLARSSPLLLLWRIHIESVVTDLTFFDIAAGPAICINLYRGPI